MELKAGLKYISTFIDLEDKASHIGRRYAHQQFALKFTI